MARTGDPIIAKSAKTWTSTNAPWCLPVQSKMEQVTSRDDSTTTYDSAPAKPGVGQVAEDQQRLDGDFNTGNGARWPVGNVKY